MSAESKLAAPVGGVDVLRAEVDARTIFDIADIRAGYDNATREDVEFKAIALRNFNAIAAVAELVAAVADVYGNEDSESCDPGCPLCRIRAALAPFQTGGAE